MDRNGPRLNRTGNAVEYLISLNILWSVIFLLPVASDDLCNTLLMRVSTFSLVIGLEPA